MIRLYGPDAHFGSRAVVTTGFRSAIEDRGLLSGFVSTSTVPDFDEEDPPGAAAPVGIFTGDPTALRLLTHSSAHRRRYVMLAPNSDKIPVPLAKALYDCCVNNGAVLTPSRWAAHVLKPYFDPVPVEVVPHGVSPHFAPDPDAPKLRAQYDRGIFRCLHLSTTGGQRKGTVELVLAWQHAVERGWLPSTAELNLVIDNQPAFFDRLEDEGLKLPESVTCASRFAGGRGGDPKFMSRMYSAHHLVCAPSRGEGFGLCPLEARACGTPVLATTRATGHAEHLAHCTETHGVVAVETGPDAPIDDLPGAAAPSLDVEAIAAALRGAYQRWPTLREFAIARAGEVRTQWSWHQQLRPFLDRLESEHGE